MLIFTLIVKPFQDAWKPCAHRGMQTIRRIEVETAASAWWSDAAGWIGWIRRTRRVMQGIESLSLRTPDFCFADVTLETTNSSDN